jgi:pimeloyl-ACP methyl ester carboxylesterase
LLVLVLLGLAIGPLFIDPNPAPGATSAASVAPAESRFVTIPVEGTDGLSLHYLALGGPEGAEPALAPSVFVLLHGFTFNAFTWDQLLGFFSLYGPVLAYDQVPYGLSAKPLPGTWQGPNPYSKQAALAQLLALLDAFEIGRTILVGNSSGGTLALEAALAQPERVEALILIGPWVHAKRPILPDWLAGLPQMRRVALLLGRWLGATSPLLDLSYADASRITPERRELTGIHRLVSGWDLAWGALLAHSLTDPVEISQHLAEVRQPVLVITGAEDAVVPVADTEATAEALPNAELVILPGCGHVPQEECPQQVAAAIRDWLAARTPAP